MGQRHQVYIFVENRNDKNQKDLTSFGNGKTTTLAYHNQWLYGRSPLYEASKVLKFCGDKKTHNKSIYEVLQSDNTRDLAEKVKWLLQISQEYFGGGKGVGYHWYCLLNDEGSIYKDKIDKGDNNDGITIIDAINKKYCFLAIEGLECDSEERMKIINFKPMSAEEYVLAYYPNKKANWLNPPKDVSKYINDAISKLKKYQVLTIEELSVMFPFQEQFSKSLNPA